MINETFAQIRARMMTTLVNTPPFSTYNLSPSKVAVYANFIDVIAYEIFNLEQMNNILQAQIEGDLAKVTTPTEAWWQAQILKFQYSATNPQVIILDIINFAPYYETVDATLRVITNCAVVTATNNILQIKVTNDGAVLDNNTVIALTAYVKSIDPAGVQFNIVNLPADRLWLDAEIFYDGQYSSVIQSSVITALINYLNTLPFNGIVEISDVEVLIKGVPGVNDVTINSIAARANSTAFSLRSFFPRFWQTVSGQILQENTASQTFADTLTFTVG